MTRRAPIVALLAVLASLSVRADPEGVRISTMVTDRAGKPVMGLALKDFELREDGVVQKLVAVEPRRAEPRRIAILLDEFHVDASDTARVRDAVTRFVTERLRPDEAVVVLKPLDSLPAIRLTDVSPAALGYVLDREGVLGLIFPSDVATVRLTVASGDVGESEWRFWVVDGRLHHDRQTKAGG